MKKTTLALAMIFCLFSEESCAVNNPPSPLLPSSQQDPLESINRPIFKFNQTMDSAFVTPVVTIYNTLIPRFIRVGVDNAFDNVSMLSTTANDILQGEFKHSIQDAWRFIINTTLGIGGLFDVASEFGLPKHYNDLGLTLAKWGYRNSTYIMVPFIGPTTIRDGAALFGDYYLFSPYPYIHSDALIWGLVTYRYITIKAQLVDANNLMNEAALDPYIFERDAYYQYRNNKINDNDADTSEYMYLDENEPQDDKPGEGYIQEDDSDAPVSLQALP